MICISAKTREERSELICFLELIGCGYKVYDSNRKGVFGNVVDFILFFIFIRKNKIKKILGAPCSRNRYVSFILRVPFASYMRSVHPDPNALTSISDILHYRLSKLGVDMKILNPYEADFIFVSTEINREFLLKRNIDTKKIFNVGAVWLKDIVLKKNQGRVIYLTQSFSAHLNIEASQEQYEVVEKISNLCSSRGVDFVLRKHPRDSGNYGFLDSSLEINTDSTDFFLRNINENDLFLGSFSTMVLEIMSLGGRFIPIKLNSVPALNSLFERYDINPISIDELEGKDFLSAMVKSKNLFSEFNENPIGYFCNL